jgi:hypothetical protein
MCCVEEFPSSFARWQDEKRDAKMPVQMSDVGSDF